ncbi:ABC transporter ATP-binding protein [Actinophytocola oryzae]|uniref:ATP-binding cassette subfamily C protein n=1 Tax=Actinophytocola oryzae TaxID=502181 RepID=A0A4R7V4M4_9PSEU|nr:ABC transporter ATP-binding protein [Actinophytocola oryzae]TDV43632.1 ATP-binding cassette subfamily C protein [Actinophytocola oryzae]
MTDTEWRLPVADARGVRRAARDIVRVDPGATALVVVATCLASLAGLGAPWLIGRIVNNVESGTPDTSTVDLLAVAIVAFAVAHMVLTRFAHYFAYRFAERSLARLREEFVDRTLALPTSVVERAGTGDLMSRTTADVATVGGALRDAVPEVFMGTLQTVLILGAMLLVSPPLAVCAMVSVSGLWFAARWYLKRARTAYLAEGAATSDLSESIAATVDGARTIEAFDLGARRVADGDARVGEGFLTRVRTLFLRCVLFPAVDFASIAAMVAVLLAGGVLYVRDLVSLGAVISAGLYAMQLINPVNQVLMWMEQVQRSGASLARLKGLGEVAPAAVGAEAPRDDRLEVTGVRYAYSGDRDVLHGVDLSVRPGERLAIVGPSGAGKSTLGRLLAGVDVPRAGRITVGGTPVALLSPEELRRRIVLVTQEHHVFLGTVRDNLAIAAPHARDDEILAALAAVDATWVRDLPQGLDTELGANAMTLDAPQAQQLALARVVLADPHTVILDEATALLDPATARHAERAMAAVLAGRTVIAIAHRLHTAHYADRVAVMAEGRITELGSHTELVAEGGEYAALWHHWHGD